jgi:hypothetical protein
MSKAIGTVTVETDNESYEIGVKRFYVPGVVLKSKCPQCGKEAEKDLGDDYLSYPATNTPIYVSMYDGEHEWTVRIIVRVTVEPAMEKDQ